MTKNLKPVRIGLFFAVLTIIVGYSLGMIFGGLESSYEAFGKNTIVAHSKAFQGKTPEDTAKKKAKAFSSFKKYAKRAHLHSGAIGAGSLGMIILLSLFGARILWFSEKVTYGIKVLFSLGFGIGGFMYASYWTLVAVGCLSNPDKYAVKEGPLSFLVIGAGAVYICALLLGLILFLSIFYKQKDEA